ncbi:hypothetical protein B5S29_g5565 [[Candida] boidinii]|nr:hypothetical protein B5S29_g5565 [[Candida] boidinii]
MKISKFNFNFHKKIIIILTILLSISSCFQLIALLTVPVTDKLTLCKYDGYEFGVFGVCKDGYCTDVRIGYKPSQLSDNYEFSLPSNARHSISYLLVVHPIATGFNIIELLLVISLFNQFLSNSINYLLLILLFMLPTFLLTLLSFLVDILLFLPHLQWCGWILLGSTVLIAISGTLLCIMRRTVSSRKSHWKNLRNTGNDLYSLNLYDDDDDESSDDNRYSSSSLNSLNLQELNLISSKFTNNTNNTIQQNPFETNQSINNNHENLNNLVLRNKIIGNSGTVIIKRNNNNHNHENYESPIHELKFTYPLSEIDNDNEDDDELLIKPGRSRLIQSPKRLRSADYSPPKLISNPIKSMFDNDDDNSNDIIIENTKSEPIVQLNDINRFKSFKSEHTCSIFMDLNDLQNELYPNSEVSYNIGDDTIDKFNYNNRKSLSLQEKLVNELNNDDNDDDYEDIEEEDDDEEDDQFNSSTRSLPVRPLVILNGPRNKPEDYNEQYNNNQDNNNINNISRNISSGLVSTTSSYYPNTNSIIHKINENNENNNVDNKSINSYSTNSSNELFDRKSITSELSNNIVDDNKIKKNSILSLSSDSSSSILNGEDLFKLNKQKQKQKQLKSESESGSESGSGVLSDTTNFTSISQRPINPRYLEMERLYNQQQQYQQQYQKSIKFKKMSRNPIMELSNDIIKNNINYNNIYRNYNSNN